MADGSQYDESSEQQQKSTIHEKIIDPNETNNQGEPIVYNQGEQNFYPICDQQVVIPVVMETVAEPRRYIHLRALAMSLFLWAGIFFNIACNIPFISLFEDRCSGMYFIPMIATIVIYIVYLVECFVTGSRHYSHVIKDFDYARNYVERMLQSPPRLYCNWENYHYETRTRLVTRTDSNGNSYTTTETYQEKVVTSTGTTPYRISFWRDFSGEIPTLPNVRALKLSCKKLYRYADKQSKKNQRAQKARILSDNKRDTYISGTTVFTIDGYRPYILLLRDKTSRPCFLHLAWYIIFTIVTLNYPYRLYIEFLCSGVVRVKFKKEISM